MRHLFTLIALHMLATSVGAQQPLQQEVEDLLSAMVTAFRTEPSSVAKFYTDDARILGGGQRAEGREQVDAYWRDATMFEDWKLEVLEVGGEGPTPWVRGRSTLHSKSGRVMVTEFVGLLRRQPEGLRFYVDMYVSASPGPRRTPEGLEG
jgi:ketosteroid isomerase-like protein